MKKEKIKKNKIKENTIKEDKWFVDAIDIRDYKTSFVRLIHDYEYKDTIELMHCKNIIVPNYLLEQDYLDSSRAELEKLWEDYCKESKKSGQPQKDEEKVLKGKGLIKQGALYKISPKEMKDITKLVKEYLNG